MNSVALAVFVKTPAFTPVKTRLAATEGKRFAETFYKTSLAAITTTLQDPALLSLISPYWVVAEQETVESWTKFPAIHQGSGALGDRMATAFETLRRSHPAVMVIGTDSPQLTADQIAEAAQWVAHGNRRRTVIGPSKDGGFYLFGANFTPERQRLESVTYSLSTTRSEFISAVMGDSELKELTVRSDLDTREDISAIISELQSLPRRNPEQESVLKLLIRHTEVT